MKRYEVRRVYQVVEVGENRYEVVDQFSSETSANVSCDRANAELASRNEYAKKES